MVSFPRIKTGPAGYRGSRTIKDSGSFGPGEMR